MENKCRYLSFSKVPLTVASTNEEGYVDSITNFPEGFYYKKETDLGIDKSFEQWKEDCLNTILDLEKRHNTLD